MCMVACAALTPPGASHVAGSLVPGVTAAIVALLSVSFAAGAWARAGLYCNHQVFDHCSEVEVSQLGIWQGAGNSR